MSIKVLLEEMRETMAQGPLRAKALVDEGKKLVGAYCTFMPWEIVNAAGLYSATLCAKSEKSIPAAEEELPRNLCPLIKSSYGHAITDTCPYFHFCDLVVGETTCDGKLKMYELMRKIKDLHLIHLPRSYHRPEDLELIKSEFEKFRRFLEERYGVEITDEKLSAAIKLRNRERQALKRLWDLGAADVPLLTGREIQEVAEGMSFIFDKEEAIAWLHNWLDQVEACGVRDADLPQTGKGPRLLVTGCPISGAMKVLDAAQEAGGQVVCFENCGGLKEMGFYVDETKDPMTAIAEKYLAIGCSIMSENTHRMDNLRSLMERFKVDGVLDVVLVACHTYAIETSEVRKVVNEAGRGYLAVETDFSQGDVGQLATRLGAFVEMLEE